MNYYSTDIINEIIDQDDLDCIVDNIRSFREDIHMLFVYFAYDKINLDYIYALLADDQNEVVFRCIDNTEFNIRNCPSAMVYRRYKRGGITTYYILMICTKHGFKKLGYASAMLDDFIGRIQKREATHPQSGSSTQKIVLSSLPSAVSYYEKYGFSITNDTLEDHPILARFEIPDEENPSVIMARIG